MCVPIGLIFNTRFAFLFRFLFVLHAKILNYIPACYISRSNVLLSFGLHKKGVDTINEMGSFSQHINVNTITLFTIIMRLIRHNT